MRSANSSANARRVEELVDEVARVEVDAEARAAVDRRPACGGGHEVVGDLGRVDLEREAHALGVEDVDDRPPALGELLVAAVDRGEVVRRERVEQVPDRRAGEAGHLRDAERARRRARCPSSARPPRRARPPGRRRPRPPAAGSPGGARRSGRRRLADEVRADRPAAEPVPLEQRPPLRRARSRSRRAPGRPRSGRPSTRARDRRSPSRRPRGELLERQVRPLAGEQRDGAGHRCSFQTDGRGTASPAAPSSEVG